MEKEFVSYEIALALKELGFDEKCFLYYGENNILRVFTIDIKDFITNSELPPQYNTCPTFSQAFRWFREKYGLIGFISFNEKSTFRVETLPHSNIKLNSYKEKYFDNNGKMWNIYEEAELECLKKLIEIVKNDRE
jgi:hypothetical protein